MNRGRSPPSKIAKAPCAVGRSSCVVVTEDEHAAIFLYDLVDDDMANWRSVAALVGNTTAVLNLCSLKGPIPQRIQFPSVHMSRKKTEQNHVRMQVVCREWW